MQIKHRRAFRRLLSGGELGLAESYLDGDWDTPDLTTLIVLGLMLSTLIISAAFATGDTVDRSLTAQGYSMLGHVDESWRAGETGTRVRES